MSTVISAFPEDPAMPSTFIARLRVRWRRLDAAFPIGLKLVLPIIAIGLTVGSVMSITMYRAEADRIREDFDARATLIAQDVNGALVAQGRNPSDVDVRAPVQRHIDALVELDPTILRINVYALQGSDLVVIAGSDRSLIGTAPESTAAAGGSVDDAVARAEEARIDGQKAMAWTLPLKVKGAGAVAVGVYLSTVDRDEALGALLRQFVIGMTGAILFASLALYVGVRLLVLRRIGRLVRAADRMQSGDFDARVEHEPSADARDEMVRLGAHFNEMAASIQALHAQLAEAATTDQLTGLYNRRHALDALTREISRARRSNEPLAVLMLDLDGLKQINDRDGHAAGDAAIREVAARMRAALRHSDLPARIGGDEFVVILPGCDGSSLKDVLRRLCREREDADPAQDVALSAGAAVLRPDDDVDTLLARADAQLYEAKRNGKRHYRIAA